MICKDLTEIPIPSFGYISKSDGRVFEYIEIEGKKLSECKRRNIGKAISETTMLPNENFKLYHEDLWNQYYGAKAVKSKKQVVRSGLYVSTLAIADRCKLYDTLIDTIGATFANIAMDYSIYQLSTSSDVGITYEEYIDKYVQFSSDTIADTWNDNFYYVGITNDDREKFLSVWLDVCKSSGTDAVYLSIESVNLDSTIGHGNTGLITALDAETGKPVYYSEFNGEKIDLKLLMNVVNVLKVHRIKVEGLILDTIFYSSGVLDGLEGISDYIMKLHSDAYPHVEMRKKYSNEIAWNLHYAYTFGTRIIFGIEKQQQLFKNAQREAFINLYYDADKINKKSKELKFSISSTIDDLQKKIDANKTRVQIPLSNKKYLSLKTENGITSIVCDYENFQRDLDEAGYFSIASSKQLGPAETYSKYHLKDASEIASSILKEQLAEYIKRTHKTYDIESTLFIRFVASIIRNAFMDACQSLEYNVDETIYEVSFIRFCLYQNKEYLYVKDMWDSETSQVFMESIGVSLETLRRLASGYNSRDKDVSDEVRRFPKEPVPEYKRRKRGGRKFGCLNKKTLEKSK